MGYTVAGLTVTDNDASLVNSECFAIDTAKSTEIRQLPGRKTESVCGTVRRIVPANDLAGRIDSVSGFQSVGIFAGDI